MCFEYESLKNKFGRTSGKILIKQAKRIYVYLQSVGKEGVYRGVAN